MVKLIIGISRKHGHAKNVVHAISTRRQSSLYGDGWFKLLKELSEKLEPIFAPYEEEYLHVVLQVKEKFGGLRFYLGWYPAKEGEEIEAAIEEAEEKAWITCEVCGEPGVVRGGGWISVLCDKHYKNEEISFE